MKLLIGHKKIALFFYASLVFCIAYLTYFRNYWYPPDLFWDENYRVVSAFQYLNHVMFMEYHPPLGKLLIALGEYIFHPNQSLNTSYFLNVDFIHYVPRGFSFVGVRFFPALFATFSAVLFFLILYKISKKRTLALLFSSFYLFDNALIVHSRGANLDSIQIFFVLSLLLYFLYVLDCKPIRLIHYFFLGLLLGLTVSVKLNGFVFLYLFLPLLYFEKKYLKKTLSWQSIFGRIILFAVAIIFIFSAAYYIHGLLGQRVLDSRYFSASALYRKEIRNRQTANPLFLPIVIRDNLIATKKFGDAIPKYNPVYEAKRGTASLPYVWPFGDKSINYRWEGIPGGTVRYLYLQENPMVWFAGVAGLAGSIIMLLRVYLFKRPVRNKRLFFLMQQFLLLYILHMVMYAYVSWQRVLFLYTYFIPLLLSLILVFIVYLYFFEEALKKHDRRLYAVTLLLIVSVIVTFWFFSPLTYYEPLTRKEFLMRSWFPFWYLRPI